MIDDSICYYFELVELKKKDGSSNGHDWMDGSRVTFRGLNWISPWTIPCLLLAVGVEDALSTQIYTTFKYPTNYVEPLSMT